MKKKKHLSERLPASQFILLFALVYGVSIGLGNLFWEVFLQRTPFVNISWVYLASANTLIPFLFIGIGQAFLLKFQFKWSAGKWILASVIGVIGMFLWHISQANISAILGASWILSWVFRRVLMLIFGLAQFVVLRRYVKHARLWMIATLVISVANQPLYSLLYRAIGAEFVFSTFGSSILMGLLGIFQGLIFGMVLTMLVRLTNKQSREQIEAADDELDKNIARLEENQVQRNAFSEDEFDRLQEIGSSS